LIVAFAIIHDSDSLPALYVGACAPNSFHVGLRASARLFAALPHFRDAGRPRILRLVGCVLCIGDLHMDFFFEVGSLLYDDLGRCWLCRMAQFPSLLGDFFNLRGDLFDLRSVFLFSLR
jgi:hypothetical protein